ncbi:MAG: autotransporter domain-containing protein [Proteobacteria bacterium]|nr:autotransporter domain-containing protein [Pseudomonadota bacterium]
MKFKTKTRFKAIALASSVFAIMQPSTAFAALVPLLLSTNTSLTPDLGLGYLFALPNITLTVTDGDIIGNSFLPLLNLTGSIDAALLANSNTVFFAGAATLTSFVGATYPIDTIEFQAAKTVNFNGPLRVNTANFAANATMNLADGVFVVGDMDNTSGVAATGSILFQGNGLLTGDVGNTNSLGLIRINAAGVGAKTVELFGDLINVATLAINDDGSGNANNASTLKLNDPDMVLTGNIIATTTNQDIVDIVNADTISGNIGSLGSILNLVRVGQFNDTTVNGNIFATSTQFQGNNTLRMTDGKVINGNVTTSANGSGDIAFIGGGQVTGNIGVINRLALITVNSSQAAGKTLELNGSTINVSAIQILGGAANPTTILLNGVSPMAVTANITTNNNNLDILNVANVGPTTITGNIGGSGKAFNLVNVGLHNSTTVHGNITAVTTQFQGNNVLSLGLGNVITGAVDAAAPATGILQFQGGGRVTGNIGNNNSLSLLTINSNGNANQTLELDGAIINIPTMNIVGNSGSPTTLLLSSQAGMTVTGNMTSSNNNVDILNVVNVGATTINGNIGAANHAYNLIKVGQNAATTINGNVYAASLQFQANNALNLGNGASVFGAIDSLLPGIGTLQFLGNATVTGNIGTVPISMINAQGPNSIINLQGDISAGAVNFMADAAISIADGKGIDALVTTNLNNQGTLNYLGSTSIDSPIGANGASLKLINFQGSLGKTATLNTNLFATNVSVNNGVNFAVPSSQVITGNLVLSNGSSLSLTTNTAPLTVTGDFSMGAGTILGLDMNNQVNAGMVNVQGTASINPLASVSILNAPTLIPNGNVTITIVTDGAGAGADLHVIPVTSNNMFTQFDTQVSGNLLQLVVSLSPISSFIPAGCSGTTVVDALDAISTSGGISGSLASIIGQLGTYSDPHALCQAIDTLVPIVDSAVLAESFGIQRHSMDILDERMTKSQFCHRHLNHPACRLSQTGFASGDTIIGTPISTVDEEGAWVKIFGLHAEQSERQHVKGYKNNAWGLAIGKDIMLSDRALIGAAFSWADLSIKDQIAAGSTEADNFQEAVYGFYEFNSPLYLKWALALAYNDYSENRNILFGNLILSPQADFHGWQTGARAEFGYDYDQLGVHIVPKVSLYYSNLSLSAYTETNVDTADQEVERAHFNMLLGGAGVKAAWDIDYLWSGFVQPEVHVMAYYDFIGDRMETTSLFVGGGPSFSTIGFKPAQCSGNVGGSISAFAPIGITVTSTVELDFKQDYHAAYGFVTMRYEW